LKRVILALLTVNAVCYAFGGTPSKALDASAWLLLLVSFEVETRYAAAFSSGRRRVALRTIRFVAGIGVIAAAIGYVLEKNVLDTINTALWIAVAVLVEIEIRRPDLVRRARNAFTWSAYLLYGGLAVLVAIWLLRREWFDAYDALLWLIAFAALESNVRAGAAPASALTPG
jgi:hypothetical protein